MTLERRVLDLLEDPSAIPPWRPELFDLAVDGADRALEALLESGRVAVVSNTLGAQLEELLATRDAAAKLSPAELAARTKAHLGPRSLFEYGTWVFFPWSRRLVHVLPELEYRELRHARNQYKITSDEQEILARKAIGIVGLSVGGATAVTLAQEGVGRVFRLADFDHLSMSNMNRLRCSVHSIGVPKVVIAAREMFEIDPYLDIALWPHGLTEENVDEFLVGSRPIDVLVEECDDLFIKLHVRERAKAHQIPVVMDTNERGMLDVERFDLEPDRPLLHGLLHGVSARDVKHLTMREKVPYVLRILAQDKFSPRLIPSLVEINETIKSWPQLAEGVTLGAGIITNVTRRILLDQFRGQGRYFVDLDDIVGEGNLVPLAPPGPIDAPFSPLTVEEPELRLPDARGEPTAEDVRRIVAHGLMAPSGGNTQPWRFVARGPVIRCYVDTSRPPTLLDFERGATHLSHGAAAFNMELAARAAGLDCHVATFPDPRDPDLVCEVSLLPASRRHDPPPLAAFIGRRVTNRKLGPYSPLEATVIEALHAAAADDEARLQLVTDPDALAELGRILGIGDRVRMLNQRMHGEMMDALRWTPAEEEIRDGIGLAQLELPLDDLAGMRAARQWSNIRFLRAIHGGGAFENPSRRALVSSSALGLLTIPGVGPGSYFRGGRTLQRVWLTATSLGIAFQPMAVTGYLWTRVERGGEGLDAEEIHTLSGLRRRFAQFFEIVPDTAEIMIFRLGRAGPPTARSLRRQVDEMLQFEE
ncbi:hypothetical protein Pth03_38990 [Planotetraspora thailandica]|uniref:THIF-type NAD/FAD binding fold domain-containing protein n=1 Tax=Planotetraspora thailandica TaxID=487172 RepID=A0A8J3V3M0_9ACTN|nr:Rv1355c family protein [Planotetraspora thailandica]GII55510.1 hypothetical protein Pth03_38990 [Planotetraspora thailandica]